MPDPVAAFAEANQAKQAAERGGMEVIATAGPTNLADTGTLQVSFPDVIDHHDLFIEVRGDNTSDSTAEDINLDSITRLALLRAGTWITSAATERLLRLGGAMSVGDPAATTFPLSLEENIGASDSTSVQVVADGAVDNVELKLIGRKNPS